MATKKTETAAKKAEAVVEEKAAPAAEAKETVKETVKKAAKKAAPAAKKAASTAKKAASTAKKTAKTVAKKAAAKAPVKEKDEVILEFGGKSVNINDIIAEVKKAYKAEGNKAAVKKVQVYVKPEENVAYYVINDVADGKKIDL